VSGGKEMEPEEIHNRVDVLEKIAAKGQFSELAKQLHTMDPADRLVIEKQMQADAKAQSFPQLPKMEFAHNGELKTVDYTLPNGAAEHDVFDASVAMLDTRDIKGKDGFHSFEKFDTKTGNLKSLDQDRLDGSHTRDEYDSATGAFLLRTNSGPAKNSG
jgi:hypothetical protein